MEPKIKLDEFEDTITISNPGAVSGTIGGGYSTDTITLSGYAYPNTITGGGYSFSNANTVSVTGGPYTIGGAGSNVSPWATYTSTPKIKLDGEGADIEVNGKSLMDMIGKIEERLNILHPNTELETEWEELRELGNKYRELEKHIKEKQATWDRLKAMPLPVID
jgi:hypothetical protein